MSTRSAVAEAAAGVAALAQVSWEDLTDAELTAAAADLARMKTQVEATLVRVAERIEATDAATDAGWASTKDFLTHLTGGRKGAGGSLLRTAERLTDLPRVRDALTTGDISLAQARVIGGRVATLPRVPELREQAADLLLERVQTHSYDATDLDRSFTTVVRQLDPDGTLLATDLARDKQERGAHHARHLTFINDAVGGVRITGYATLEDVELLKATLMPLAAPQTTPPGACGGDPKTSLRRDAAGRRTGRGCPDPACAHDGTDPRDSGARMWDALTEACRRLAGTDSLPHAHGTSARITVTIPYTGLHDQATGQGLLPSGDPISAAAVRRLACDAEIIPAVLGTHSQVLDLGRTQRLVTTGIWNALVLRDQHCAFPGCTRLPIACDAHHITHWADGGPTNLDNLVLLCRRHHTHTHHTPWQVHLDPNTRRPVWTPPPDIDDRTRFTYVHGGPAPPLVA